MGDTLVIREPNPYGPRVRRFFDNRQIPYRNLHELRKAMVEDDKLLIGFIGDRMMEDLWVDSVVDLSKSARSNAGRMAELARPGHHGFPGMVEAVYAVLAPEISPVIDGIDESIIATIAARTGKAMLATAFKWDRGEGIAPAQQALNQERAVRIAKEAHNTIPEAYGNLSAVVHDVYDVLVPITANVLQQAEFRKTVIDDWDAGLADAFSGLDLTV